MRAVKWVALGCAAAVLVAGLVVGIWFVWLVQAMEQEPIEGWQEEPGAAVGSP
ncbi:hypothetical protein [Streptomonospora litoralis]|uniref:Uncharacterized protein n=1 Tax=Streptomonospora litoralis TaxID=2498135 RepID=A0A4P6Q3S8_9ACTN|nr:hypothetical protein [Streptomonospora litoralis]QBI55348.1 hypothetical protein EKD16_17910 [Streptomonospora litoralis]